MVNSPQEGWDGFELHVLHATRYEVLLPMSALGKKITEMFHEKCSSGKSNVSQQKKGIFRILHLKRKDGVWEEAQMPGLTLGVLDVVSTCMVDPLINVDPGLLVINIQYKWTEVISSHTATQRVPGSVPFGASTSMEVETFPYF